MNTQPQPQPQPQPGPTRVFTGLKPTGQLQVGNLLGAIRPLLALTTEPGNDVTVSIADLHALTVAHDPRILGERTLEMAATLIACGLPERSRLFVQSSVRGYTELHYLLESVATYGEMHRMVAFKDKTSADGAGGQGSHRASLLTYPVLMAADCLATRAEVVPVGADQKQHLELSRTIARRFNRTYGDVFTLPRGVTPSQGARVKDLAVPTSKMGKSGAEHQGVVFLADSPDVVAAKVRRATTDTDRALTFDPVGRPGVANLATILGALTDQSPEAALVGLNGSGALKAAVTEALVETLAPVQAGFAEVMADRGMLLARLRDDRDAVSVTVEATVAAAREAMGLVAL